MFRIEFFTDDRYVTALMRLLAGKTHDLKVEPVIGVQKTARGLTPTSPDGKIVNLLAIHLAKNNIKKIDSHELRQWLGSIGRAPGSVEYLKTQGMKANLLRKQGTGRGAYWQVMSAPQPKSKAKTKSKSQPVTKTKSKAKPKKPKPEPAPAVVAAE